MHYEPVPPRRRGMGGRRGSGGRSGRLGSELTLAASADNGAPGCRGGRSRAHRAVRAPVQQSKGDESAGDAPTPAALVEMVAQAWVRMVPLMAPGPGARGKAQLRIAVPLTAFLSSAGLPVAAYETGITGAVARLRTSKLTWPVLERVLLEQAKRRNPAAVRGASSDTLPRNEPVALVRYPGGSGRVVDMAGLRALSRYAVGAQSTARHKARRGSSLVSMQTPVCVQGIVDAALDRRYVAILRLGDGDLACEAFAMSFREKYNTTGERADWASERRPGVGAGADAEGGWCEPALLDPPSEVMTWRLRRATIETANMINSARGPALDGLACEFVVRAGHGDSGTTELAHGGGELVLLAILGTHWAGQEPSWTAFKHLDADSAVICELIYRNMRVPRVASADLRMPREYHGDGDARMTGRDADSLASSAVGQSSRASLNFARLSARAPRGYDGDGHRGGGDSEPRLAEMLGYDDDEAERASLRLSSWHWAATQMQRIVRGRLGRRAAKLESIRQIARQYRDAQSVAVVDDLGDSTYVDNFGGTGDAVGPWGHGLFASSMEAGSATDLAVAASWDTVPDEAAFEAARTIQAAERRRQARRTTKVMRSLADVTLSVLSRLPNTAESNEAATKVQKLVRGRQARKKVKAEFVRQDSQRLKKRSSRKLRKKTRSGRVRSRSRKRDSPLSAHGASTPRSPAATTPTSGRARRGDIPRLPVLEPPSEEQHAASVHVQRMVRARLARKTAQVLRVKHEHARSGPSLYGAIARRQDHDAALMLQRIVRGHFGRQTFKIIRLHNGINRRSDAAAMIQASWRRHQARTAVKVMRQRRLEEQLEQQREQMYAANAAAVLIQAAWRGWCSRRELKVRRYGSAAVTTTDGVSGIQSEFNELLDRAGGRAASVAASGHHDRPSEPDDAVEPPLQAWHDDADDKAILTTTRPKTRRGPDARVHSPPGLAETGATVWTIHGDSDTAASNEDREPSARDRERSRDAAQPRTGRRGADPSSTPPGSRVRPRSAVPRMSGSNDTPSANGEYARGGHTPKTSRPASAIVGRRGQAGASQARRWSATTPVPSLQTTSSPRPSSATASGRRRARAPPASPMQPGANTPSWRPGGRAKPPRQRRPGSARTDARETRPMAVIQLSKRLEAAMASVKEHAEVREAAEAEAVRQRARGDSYHDELQEMMYTLRRTVESHNAETEGLRATIAKLSQELKESQAARSSLESRVSALELTRDTLKGTLEHERSTAITLLGDLRGQLRHAGQELADATRAATRATNDATAVRQVATRVVNALELQVAVLGDTATGESAGTALPLEALFVRDLVDDGFGGDWSTRLLEARELQAQVKRQIPALMDVYQRYATDVAGELVPAAGRSSRLLRKAGHLTGRGMRTLPPTRAVLLSGLMRLATDCGWTRHSEKSAHAVALVAADFQRIFTQVVASTATRTALLEGTDIPRKAAEALQRRGHNLAQPRRGSVDFGSVMMAALSKHVAAADGEAPAPGVGDDAAERPATDTDEREMAEYALDPRDFIECLVRLAVARFPGIVAMEQAFMHLLRELPAAEPVKEKPRISRRKSRRGGSPRGLAGDGRTTVRFRSRSPSRARRISRATPR